jgi:NAD+ synthase
MLTPLFETFVKGLPPTEKNEEQLLSLANTRARLRMSTLYYFAALHNYLVAGTGNKVEDFGVGFYTKYGDGGVDLSPIADLLKTEVYGVAKYLNIIESIQVAPPTDGLWSDNRTDQQQIGVDYDELEWAMNELEKNPSMKGLTPKQTKTIQIYLNFNRQNQHKMNPIPVCEIPVEFLV